VYRTKERQYNIPAVAQWENRLSEPKLRHSREERQIKVRLR